MARFGCRLEERQRLEALRDAQAGAIAAATPAPPKGKPAKPDPKVHLWAMQCYAPVRTHLREL